MVGLAAVVLLLWCKYLAIESGASPDGPSRGALRVLSGHVGEVAEGPAHWLSMVVSALVIAPLAVAAFVDSVHHLLPDPLLLIGACIAVGSTLLWAVEVVSAEVILQAFFVGCMAFAVGFLLSVLTSLGRGDAKLLGVLGLWLGGPLPLLAAMGVALCSAGVYAIGLMAFRRASRTTALALGPWLVGGTSISWVVFI